MSTGVHAVEVWWLGAVERDCKGIAETGACCEIADDCSGCRLGSKGREGLAVFFTVGPQSSSHEGLLFVDEFCAVGFDNGSERSPLTDADDTLTSGVPDSVIVTPRFSSIFLQEEEKNLFKFLSYLHMK